MATATATDKVSSMFDQAVQTFGDALKAGVKVQEQVTGWWTDALDQMSGGNDWQKKQRSILNDVIPAAQRSTEEWLKLVEQSYQRSVDMMKKAFTAQSAGASAQEAQAKAVEVWQSSLTMVKENAQAVAHVNAKVMELWADLLRKNLNTTRAAVAAATSASK